MNGHPDEDWIVDLNRWQQCIWCGAWMPRGNVLSCSDACGESWKNYQDEW